MIDSKGSNAFHFLATNLIDKQAIEDKISADAPNRNQLIDDSYNEQMKYLDQTAQILMNYNDESFQKNIE